MDRNYALGIETSNEEVLLKYFFTYNEYPRGFKEEQFFLLLDIYKVGVFLREYGIPVPKTGHLVDIGFILEQDPQRKGERMRELSGLDGNCDIPDCYFELWDNIVNMYPHSD